MTKYLFGDLVKEVKNKVDRDNNPYEFFIAGDHMDTDELHLLRRGVFAGNDVGPAFIRIFKPGQVLYGSRRTYLRKVAVADFEGVTANTTFVLESKDETILLQRLLPFIMQSDRFVQHSIKRSKGSTNPYVLFSDLADYEIELPNIDKQRELADLLWAIDDVRMSYKKLIVATDELVKSQFIEMHSQYPRVKFKELFTTHARIGWQKLTQKEFLDEGEYYLVTGWDIMPDKTVAFSQCKYVTKERYEQDPKLILSKGDVLLTKDGTLGKVAIIGDMDKPATLNGHIFVIRPKDERMLPEFLLGILTSADFVDQMYRNKTGSTIVGITQKAILEFDVPLAPVEAQKEYILFARQSDKSKFELKKALSELTATYKQIIKENIG